MSEIRANSITDAAGTGAPNFPNGLESDGVAVATTADLGGITLLGTIATTSGSSVTLSGLDLTSYKQLSVVFNNVSGSNGTIDYVRLNSKNICIVGANNQTHVGFGFATIDLASGTFWTLSSYTGAGGATSTLVDASGLSTASTSITFTISAGNFDAGSITIYGVK